MTYAAKAGAEMETGFKRKIFDASQVVNELSEKMKERLKLYRDYKAHFDSTISFLEEVAKKLPQHF